MQVQARSTCINQQPTFSLNPVYEDQAEISHLAFFHVHLLENGNLAVVMHQKGLVHGQGFYQSIHAKPTNGEAQNLMSKVLNTTQQKSCGIGVYPNMT